MSIFIRPIAEWNEINQRISAGPVAGGGDKSALYASGCEAAKMIDDMVFVTGMRVAEIGSGNGRNAMGLTNYPLREYTGVEIIRQCVEFCQMAFEPWDNYSFKHADIYNARYNAGGKTLPQDAVYPLESGAFDIVLLMSVLTHEPDHLAVKNILSEAWRSLDTGGVLLSTWFSYPHDGEPSSDHARVVFTVDEIKSFLSSWDIINAARPGGDQWYIVTQKK